MTKGREVKTVTRSDLKSAVYDRVPSLSRADAGKITEAVIEEIIAALVAGEDVKLHGVGIFKLRRKKERIGRNPKTGKDAVITPRRVVTFAPSKLLVAFMNGEATTDEARD
jgi:integration host factor subunit alpha